MKHILKCTALLLVPVLLYFGVFIAFEPNNYFGLRQTTSAEAPIARLQSFERSPGNSIIIGDSRFAHFDMEQVREVSGREWQNLAFGGASLKEGVDLLEWAMEKNPNLQEVVFGLSFYTINQSYNTDRMSSLEKTLSNPLAYLFNLEYNVNMLTALSERLRGLPSGAVDETGDWAYPADYTAANGTVYELHTRLAEYPATIAPRCRNWALNGTELEEFRRMAQSCQQKGIKLTVVLAPMADNVLNEVCVPFGIDTQMTQELLPRLDGWGRYYGFSVLDYEWQNRPAFDDDTQFFDGFHLDTRHGLPQWVSQLFTDIG